MYKTIILCILCFTQFWVSAQVTGEVNVLDPDLMYFHYTPPNVITDDFQYQRWSSRLNAPPVKTNKFAIYNSVGLDVHRLTYESDTFKKSDALDHFYNINYCLSSSYQISDKWSVNVVAAPFLLSNFEGAITRDDIFLNGNLHLERTFKSGNGGFFKLGIGAAYVTLNGQARLVPITHVKAKFNERYSLVIGLPNTYFKWDINKKNSLKALIDLNDFSANLSGDNHLISNDADKAVFTIASAGVEYNLWLLPSFGMLFRATKSLWNSYQVRDNEQEEIYAFNTALKQPFISVGFKYNPFRSNQNNSN